MPFHDEGFFHALQQNPEDNALRLVYSDFLEDRGDEASLAHAELIRVQVELAALSPLILGAAERAAELTARQNELIARWQRLWLGDWAEVLHGWTFRRGLVEAVAADASVFLDNAAEWFAEWPTLAVAKLTRAAGHLPELAASPWLAHLRGLDLSNNGIDSAALAYLTGSRFICLLQALDLSDNPIGPRGAALLVTARSADELCELHLARCGLWHEGLLTLLGNRADQPMRLRRLDLSGNELYRLSLVRLADSPLMENLESLDLSGNPLGDNGASVLADSPNAGGLVDLGLCGTGTGDVEVAALAGSRNLSKLRSLDLRCHHCGYYRDRNGRDMGGIAELARSPLLGQVRRLLLGNTTASNGWPAQVLSGLRVPLPLGSERPAWVVGVLRQSRYLVPSQLLECDLEDLWWLGDTQNRERRPSNYYQVVDCLHEFPELLDEMDLSEAAVLRMRYGLNEEPRTLREISEHLCLPREGVQQIESDALGKLWRLRRQLPVDC
jgi:uncharacterized protein (TIGR02996 family)